ncbi:MAG: hypothetical protein IJ072_07855 [Oscillospiraceae bacterium]|nr:hypothetical protein [Oscillospiraceae bacterium]
MEQTNPKGSGFLKVCGILMIIGGALGIILSLTALAGVAALSALAETSGGMLTVACIVSLVSAVLELVAGIVGVANCKKPEKATACMVWGIIVAVLCVVGQIISVAAGGTFNVLSCIVGLVLPVLFIIGAALNKKSA